MIQRRGTSAQTLFAVNSGSAEPIYSQLVEQVRRLVAAGQLGAGDMLPSVRDVAASLAVNPMTVSKAYSQLELEGLVARRHGIGMVITTSHFDTQSEAARIASRLRLLTPTLERAAVEAHQLGIDADAATKLFLQLLKATKLKVPTK